MGSQNLLLVTEKLFTQAVDEIDKSNSILTKNGFHLTTITYTRQLFELAMVIEILCDNPDHILSYHLEMKKISLKKTESSKFDSAKERDYIKHEECEIKALENYMQKANVTLEQWGELKSAWNKDNKDSALYNKLSEGTHMEANFLIVHFLQTREVANNLKSANSSIDISNYNEEQRQNIDNDYFNKQLERCRKGLLKLGINTQLINFRF